MNTSFHRFIIIQIINITFYSNCYNACIDILIYGCMDGCVYGYMGGWMKFWQFHVYCIV